MATNSEVVLLPVLAEGGVMRLAIRAVAAGCVGDEDVVAGGEGGHG